ncbi:HAMP domain-containing sensor histidine kinase [Streptomyces sp. GXMU-J15]|uniref:histidine kinase n=1 Tax=Streptomyces fuscus TaxID=3048495 RepID=A0ABT7J0P3_9ACTN|nr:MULTISPECIES: HAMP domain-containing sensor histidine kinase [Streptomyces]MDL2077936.1 HAMP domain-containing sensor histidine kinase [Streptomyces fuscus]
MTARLLLTYVGLTLLVLLGLEIPLGLRYAADARDRITDAARAEAESAAAYTALSMAGGQGDSALSKRAAHCAERVGGRMVIVDGAGRVLASSHPLSAEAAGELPRRPGIAAMLKGADTMDVRTATVGGTEQLSVTAPVADGMRGAVWLTVPTQTVRDRVNQVWLLLWVGGLVVLGAVAVIGLGLARWAGHPIRELERATHALAEGGMPAPVPVTKGPREVRRLAAAFNRTAARLAHLLAAQRAFAGEASHQLRTPLAALRLRLENLEPNVRAAGRGSLAAAVTETDRLARMVEGLLAMARLEEDAATPLPVDVGEVCAERHATWLPLFQREGVDLVLFAGSVGPVMAVPGAVEQILDNLLSNALRASPVDSAVTIELRLSRSARALRDSRPHWVDLHVTDEGPGMNPEQRKRAFDRFWRAPGAPKGGTGLGLSLVQRLAMASGGSATLHAATTGGLDAVVRLPSALPPHIPRQPRGRTGARRREVPALPG